MRRPITLIILLSSVLTIGGFGCKSMFPPSAPRVEPRVIVPNAGESMDYERPPKSNIKGEYILEPTDVIRVEIHGHADLSNTLQIRPDGKITMPLLDDVEVGGLTPSQVDDLLTELMKKYLKEVDISVSVVSFNSKQVHFIGPAGNSVQIPYTGEMTVLDLVTRIGGIPEISAPENTLIVRGDVNKPQMIKVNLKDVVYRGDYKDNILLREGDVVILPANFFSQLSLTVQNFVRGAGTPAQVMGVMTGNVSATRGLSDELETNRWEVPFHFHKPRSSDSGNINNNP